MNWFYDYAGYWAVLSFLFMGLSVLVLLSLDTTSSAKVGYGSIVSALVFLGIGIMFLVTWDRQVDKAQRIDYASRECQTVALEQLDVSYQGTPYILDEVEGRQRICKR